MHLFSLRFMPFLVRMGRSVQSKKGGETRSVRWKVQYFNWDGKDWREAKRRVPMFDGPNMPDVLG